MSNDDPGYFSLHSSFRRDKWSLEALDLALLTVAALWNHDIASGIMRIWGRSQLGFQRLLIIHAGWFLEAHIILTASYHELVISNVANCAE